MGTPSAGSVVLISLDSLPLGDVPRQNNALGEFHCIRPDARYAGWYEPTIHWTWRASNWRVGEDAGAPVDSIQWTVDSERRADGSPRFIEQLHDSRHNNTLIVHDTAMRSVRCAEVEVACARVEQEAGLVFAFPDADTEDVASLPVTLKGGLDASKATGEQLVEIYDEIGLTV